MKEDKKDTLVIRIYDDRMVMGKAAAEVVSTRIDELLERQPVVNIVFAAAPSQNEFLAEMAEMELDWRRVNAFQMDEYIGLATDAPQGFGNFLRERLFSRVPLGEVHYMDGMAPDRQEECGRYSRLLERNPTDIVVLGIGENTHLAFNDPHVARFNDPVLVKIVDLDEDSRQQQVNDGCFTTIGEVPTHALTLTLPALFNASYAYAIVPGKRKAWAVERTLKEEIGPGFPSTILRRHPHAILFVDGDSAGKT